MKIASFSLILLLSHLAINSIYCQEPSVIKRISVPVEFDGRPFESAWDQMAYFPLKMNRPNFGNDPSESTEVMIAYDNEYIWVGARLFMLDAKKIFANSKKRDEMLFGYENDIILPLYACKCSGLVLFFAC